MEQVLEAVARYVREYDLGEVIWTEKAMTTSCPLAIRSGGALAFFRPTSRENLFAAWRQAQTEIAGLPLPQVRTAGRFLTLLVLDEQEGDTQWERITHDLYVCRKLVIPTKERSLHDWIDTLPFLPIRSNEGPGQQLTSPVKTLVEHSFTPELGKGLVSQRPGAEVLAQSFLEGAVVSSGPVRVEAEAESYDLASLVSNRLERIQLRNFRAFSGDFDLQMDADMVVIYGTNGSGKTSICQALELGILGEVESLEKKFDDDKALKQSTSPYINADHTDQAAHVWLTISSQRNNGVPKKEVLLRKVSPNRDTEVGLVPESGQTGARKSLSEAQAVEVALASKSEAYTDVRRLRVIGRQAHFLDQDTIRSWLKEEGTARYDALSRLTGTADFQQALAKLGRVEEALVRIKKAAVDDKDSAAKELKRLREKLSLEYPQYSPSGVTGSFVEQREAQVRALLASAANAISGDVPDDVTGLATVGPSLVAAALTSSGEYLDRLSRADRLEREWTASVIAARDAQDTLATLNDERRRLQQRGRDFLSRIAEQEQALQSASDQLRGAEAEQSYWGACQELAAMYRQGETTVLQHRETEAAALAAYRRLKTRAEKLSGDLATVDQRTRSLATRQEERNRQVGIISALVQSSPRLVDARSRYLELTISLADLGNQVRTLDSNLDEQQKQLTHLEALLQKVTDQLSVAEERYGTWKSLLAEMAGYIQSDTCPLCGWDHARGDLARRVDERLNNLPEEVRTLQEEAGRLAGRVTISGSAASQLKKALKDKRARIAEMDKEAAELHREWLSWTDEVRSLGEGFTIPDDMSPADLPNLLHQFLSMVVPDDSEQLDQVKQLRVELHRQQAELAPELAAAQSAADSATADRQRMEAHLHQVTGRLAALNLNSTTLASEEVYLTQHNVRASVVREQRTAIERLQGEIEAARDAANRLQQEITQNSEREKPFLELVQREQQVKDMCEQAFRDVNLRSGQPTHQLREEADARRRVLYDLQECLGELASLVTGLGREQGYQHLLRQVEEAGSVLEQKTTAARQAELSHALLNRAKTALSDGAEQEQIARLIAYEPLINEIYRRVQAHPKYPYLHLTVKDKTVFCHALRSRGDRQRLTVPRYFSMAQQNIVALSVFLSAALLQSWSGLQLICLDDPIQQMDDINPTSFLDVLRGILQRKNRRHQIVITTANREFYKLLIGRYAYLNENGRRGLLAYRLTPAPDGVDVTNDSPVVDARGLVTLQSGVSEGTKGH